MQTRTITPSDYLFILGTILFTVYGQIVLKWQVSRLGPLPFEMGDKLLVLARLLVNPWVMSCIVAGLLAFFCWIVALTRFQLTYAYPFVSVTFALVLILGAVFFGESLTVGKVVGVAFIVLGVVIGSRG
jgi:multidrug transporter EmrE-like cation transporter